MDVPKRMRGIWLTGHGGLDKLELRDDLSVPTPSPLDVLIRVAAAGVNNTDLNTRTAWYSKQDAGADDASWSGEPITFPRVQGADVCGRIVAVGSSVPKKRVGQRVLIEPCIRESGGLELEKPWYFGSECDGGFAEYTVVAARHAYHVESELSDVELASFPCSYSTAENMLMKSDVGAADTILVTGASGGVGSATIQLAKMRGARVFAVTTPDKSAAVLELGAERWFDRECSLIEALGCDSIDVVIDLVAGAKWPELLDVLRPGGRYAVAGAIGGPIVELDIRTLYLKDLSFFGCTVLEPDVFKNLVRHIESGNVGPVVSESFSLEQIAEAQNAFMSKKHTGKIVLTIIP